MNVFSLWGYYHLNAKVAKIFLNQIGRVWTERYHKSLTSMIEISVKNGLCQNVNWTKNKWTNNFDLYLLHRNGDAYCLANLKVVQIKTNNFLLPNETKQQKRDKRERRPEKKPVVYRFRYARCNKLIQKIARARTHTQLPSLLLP